MSGRREVAVVAFAQRQARRSMGSPTCVDLIVPVFQDLWAQTGLTRHDIDFWCSGSSDYLAGRSFSFVQAVDAIGAYPPVNESHVEMDPAWAMYEAWVKLQTGEIDTAIAFGFGQSSPGVLRRVLALQLDPYSMAPLWPDTVSLAALQARLVLEAGVITEAQIAQVVLDSRAAAADNPAAVVVGDPGTDIDQLLARPMYADPLRVHDCAPVSDGAAAVMLVAGDRARELARHPAWITGIEHRIDPQHVGLRDLTAVDSAGAAARALGPGALDGLEVAELHAPFAHQNLLLRTALGLPGTTLIDPSGGSLTGNPMFAGGLIRIGEAAARIHDGSATKVLGHATSGPLLQQNLVALMERSSR